MIINANTRRWSYPWDLLNDHSCASFYWAALKANHTFVTCHVKQVLLASLSNVNL
eukprot:Gb_15760 [translate_table: standard]